MNIYDDPNMLNFQCPICGTKEDKPVTIIPIAEKKDGLTYEARQYHVDCIQLFEYDVLIGKTKLLCMEFSEVKK